MNILHIGANDNIYGADRAAYRIHQALVEYGSKRSVYSAMRVINKHSDDLTVTGGPPKFRHPILRRIIPRLQNLRSSGFRTGNPVLHSMTQPEVGLGRELFRKAPQEIDILHLHWLGNETLSIEDIGLLKPPLVWTLHDQWAFCGAEHYTTPPVEGQTQSNDERFVQGYTRASRPNHETGPDLNRRTWQRKRRAWRHPIEIICPSTWMADCARRSALMASWPITVIPYPIDLELWAPVEQQQARKLLNLPLDRPLVLFGAIGGTANSRKGGDLLIQALQHLRIQLAETPLANLELVVFGENKPAVSPCLGFPVHYAGRIHDDLRLRLLYAASDLLVIASRQDNLPNTGLEAHACGTPVVAFRTGGLVDIIDEHVTGALADPFKHESLAHAIRWVLQDPLNHIKLRAAARKRAEALWAPQNIASRYFDIYARAIQTNTVKNLLA